MVEIEVVFRRRVAMNLLLAGGATAAGARADEGYFEPLRAKVRKPQG
jgi:hypothetical protein